MYILIVEDDNDQYQFISKALLASKMVDVTRLERISTEKDFIDKLEDLATNKPDAIVMDIMLRWAYPDPEMKSAPTTEDLLKIPEEVRKEGFYRAGLRCEKRLAADPQTSDIPIIIYSILQSKDLEKENSLPQRAGVRFMEKNFDSRAIERALRDMTR
jgi:CheY-like chemotaxis protein